MALKQKVIKPFLPQPFPHCYKEDPNFRNKDLVAILKGWKRRETRLSRKSYQINLKQSIERKGTTIAKSNILLCVKIMLSNSILTTPKRYNSHFTG